MSERKAEGRSKGLEDEDLDLIFPGPDEDLPISRQAETPVRDYKKAAAGERDDQEPRLDDHHEVESEEQGIPSEEAIRDLAQKTCRTMIDGAADERPFLKRVKSEVSPSDKTWASEIRRILWPAGPGGGSAPRFLGSVRADQDGHNGNSG